MRHLTLSLFLLIAVPSAQGQVTPTDPAKAEVHRNKARVLIEQKDWNYLQTSIEYPNYKLTSNVENLVKELLETVSTN